nr:unnamed protein product [Digitaria exilis]
MADHKEVFRSLQELFPQVDHRILKAIAIEHRKDVDSAVVAILDEVMPFITGSAGVFSAHHEVLPSRADSVGNVFANNSTHEVGSSSSADKEASSAGTSGVIEQKSTSNAGTGSNKQLSGDIDENEAILLSSKTMLPDLNLNHFGSMASTHSSHSVSIESLEDSIADARSNKHAGEVCGEKAILTTEARQLQSRLHRLSDERNKYLVIIEEIHQTLDERLVAAQQEIAAAEKEKIEKEAAAQALLDEQEKMMNSIVEESRKLQKEAEENLKLKEFLVERGQIVDTLQGEMAVICEDVSLLKRVVDERLSLSKLQRSTMSSLSSSLHSSLHKSGSSLGRTTEAVESSDKDTVGEVASPVAEGLDDNASIGAVSDGNDSAKGICKRQSVSNEDGDDWLIC